VGSMIVHRNADFPFTLGMDTSSAGLPFFFSDHDVPLLLLDFQPDEAEVKIELAPVPAENSTVKPATIMPVVSVTPGVVGERSKGDGPKLAIIMVVGGTAVLAGLIFVVLIRRRQ